MKNITTPKMPALATFVGNALLLIGSILLSDPTLPQMETSKGESGNLRIYHGSARPPDEWGRKENLEWLRRDPSDSDSFGDCHRTHGQIPFFHGCFVDTLNLENDSCVCKVSDAETGEESNKGKLRPKPAALNRFYGNPCNLKNCNMTCLQRSGRTWQGTCLYGECKCMKPLKFLTVSG